jgi:hypothetical protein
MGGTLPLQIVESQPVSRDAATMETWMSRRKNLESITVEFL